MLDNIEIKELSLDDISNNILDNFNRYEEVEKFYVKENGNWIVKNIKDVLNWDKNKKNNIIEIFSEAIIEGGYVFGAYDNKKMIGFSVLLNNKFGFKKNYIRLKFLHVSFKYRHKGIGKILFELCVEKAKSMGIEKIYISAANSEAAQIFYLGVGCKDAMEINKIAAENEPYDRQMEYII
ncbi:GNAT family N-acetyltransferase [Spirochaetia bacterium]|nr:GNAT family N-acetyltransferase [Spirochaetia bacterium]